MDSGWTAAIGSRPPLWAAILTRASAPLGPPAQGTNPRRVLSSRSQSQWDTWDWKGTCVWRRRRGCSPLAVQVWVHHTKPFQSMLALHRRTRVVGEGEGAAFPVQPGRAPSLLSPPLSLSVCVSVCLFPRRWHASGSEGPWVYDDESTFPCHEEVPSEARRRKYAHRGGESEIRTIAVGRNQDTLHARVPWPPLNRCPLHFRLHAASYIHIPT